MVQKQNQDALSKAFSDFANSVFAKLSELESEISELKNKPVQKEYYNLKEACKFLSCKTNTIYRLVFENKLVSFKRGKYLFFKETDLQAYLHNTTKPQIKVSDVEMQSSNYFIK